MVIAIGTTLAVAGRRAAIGVILARHRHRRRDRHLHRAAHPDDGAAAAGRRLPQPGRPRRGVRRRRGLLRAGRLRHRRARRDPRQAAWSRWRSAPRSAPSPSPARSSPSPSCRASSPASRWSSRASIRSTRCSASLLRGAHRLVRRRRSRRWRSGLIVVLSLAAGLPAHPADRRRRHAGRDLDAQFLFGLGGLRHRLHAGQQRC